MVGCDGSKVFHVSKKSEQFELLFLGPLHRDGCKLVVILTFYMKDNNEHLFLHENLSLSLSLHNYL